MCTLNSISIRAKLTWADARETCSRAWGFFGNIGCQMFSNELTFVGISATGQTAGGTLTRKCLVTEGLKVGTSFRSRSKVDLAARVDHDDPVEEVADALTGLVEGNESGLAENVRHDPQGLDGLKCGVGVQSTR